MDIKKIIQEGNKLNFNLSQKDKQKFLEICIENIQNMDIEYGTYYKSDGLEHKSRKKLEKLFFKKHGFDYKSELANEFKIDYLYRGPNEILYIEKVFRYKWRYRFRMLDYVIEFKMDRNELVNEISFIKINKKQQYINYEPVTWFAMLSVTTKKNSDMIDFNENFIKYLRGEK